MRPRGPSARDSFSARRAKMNLSFIHEHPPAWTPRVGPVDDGEAAHHSTKHDTHSTTHCQCAAHRHAAGRVQPRACLGAKPTHDAARSHQPRGPTADSSEAHAHVRCNAPLQSQGTTPVGRYCHQPYPQGEGGAHALGRPVGSAEHARFRRKRCGCAHHGECVAPRQCACH
jgi:hypothetical protein